MNHELFRSPEYAEINQLNREHGRIDFCERWITGKLAAEISHTSSEFIHPNVPVQELRAYGVSKRKTIEKVSATYHGQAVKYEKLFDKKGRLLAVVRTIRQADGEFTSPLIYSVRHNMPHIHISSLNDNQRDHPYFGQQVIYIPTNDESFEQLIDAITWTILQLKGSIEVPPESARVPKHLALGMIREYVNGLRQGAVEYQQEELLPQIDKLLDRIK